MKKYISILLLTLCSLAVQAAGKQTFVFNIAGNDTLRLDVYQAQMSAKPAPALIFAFGGAFMGGTRDDARYVPMFEFLADNGVTVISTDYRTRLKGLNPAAMSQPSLFADRLVDAVTCAVSDFFKATAYTVANAQSWNIDPKQIFACGSSAGAITALQAEYELCNAPAGMPGLPADFNYAGVISFAGAIFSDGEPEWARQPAPLLLFHGDADSNVPFNNATMDDFGLWGSENISNNLVRAGVSHWFHRFNGSDHSIAISPMTEQCGEVLDFIHAVIDGRVKLVLTTESTPGAGNYRTDFSIHDYMMSNMK